MTSFDDLQEKQISGFINIDKPVDWTSHDVVAKLRRILGIKRIGHTGTLDPFATGVLPIAIGSSTRLIRFLKKSKRYLAEIDLRNTTDTDDLTGQALRERSGILSQEDFQNKINTMLGTFQQIPPLYSAKKINGKKLYEMMRAGESIDLSDLEPKSVTVFETNLLSYQYPIAKVEISCSEGTYIRAIARDIGGHLISLRRLESNGFDIKSAIRFEDLEDGDLDLEDLILDAKEYLDLPKLVFNEKEIISLQQGRKVNLSEASLRDFGDSLIKTEEKILQCLDSSQELVGLASVSQEGDRYYFAQPSIIL